MELVDGLTFDAESHAYQFEGRPVPSVTQILDPFSGLEFVNPEILAAAAEFGNHVHDAVDMYNRGTLDEAWLMEESSLVWQYLEGWKRFLKESGAVVVSSEQKVYHPKLQYAGTLDSICAISKTNRIYDVKTGSAVPKTVGPQVEAYNRAYAEQTGSPRMKRYCVHLKEGGYNVVPLQDPRDWDIFRAALTLYRWRH